MQAGKGTGDGGSARRGARIRRRDRHGRGLRGVLAPDGLPLHRTRAQRFDDLVLAAVARLESRWEAQLCGIEFAVEEIPPASTLSGTARGTVPLARLDPGLPRLPGGKHDDRPRADALIRPGPAGESSSGGTAAKPPRIVVYRRPLLARADTEDDLGDLVFEVVVEEFARLLGLDPHDVDPGYSGAD